MALSPAQSLTPIYWAVRALSYTDPQRAIRLIREAYAQLLDDLEAYTAPPDIWFNMSVVCSRLREYDAEAIMWDGGLHAWPDDVDLLCSTLQEYFGSGNPHYNPTKAQEIWGRLSTMPLKKTGPNWRFWVFGAQYHARLLFDTQLAMTMLNDGLRYVRRENLMDVLRAYRSILIDTVPLRPLVSEEDVKRYQEEIFNIIEQKWLFGINLGVENGYVLALELGRLYQERAGYSSTQVVDGNSRPTMQQADYLNKGMEYLDLAERLYTGDSNHSIEDIYKVRVRILMALRSYGDALNLMRSLPDDTLENDQSFALMLRFARFATGTNPEGEEMRSHNDIAREVLQDLFEPSGENLRAFLASNPAVIDVIFRVLNEMK